MIENREVCLFLTLKCNQQCKYCHRFLGINELDLEHNKQVINRVAADGIKNMTFTGGEPLLYPNILELLKLAKEKGIRSKIITNGDVLANNPKMREIYNYLDSITFSIDSVDNEINEKLGRGYNHFKNIRTVLNSLKEYNLKININTVVSSINMDSLEKLGEFLKEYKINAWRIFKFIPLRETAKINKEIFEISTEEFRKNRPLFNSFSNIGKVEYREDEDMESKYVLIMPNGNVVITENKQDVTIGNILENSLGELLKNRITKKAEKVIRKIRTLIAYDNNEIKNKIVNILNEIGDIEIVATTKGPIDTYNKIVEIKPEMVFSEYNFGTEMNGLDIIKQSKEKLKEDVPAFNFIASNIAQEEYLEAKRIIGDKMNTIIREQTAVRYIGIIEDYKEYLGTKK